MPAPIPITVFGVRYRSLRKLAKTFNFAESTLHRHLTVYRAEPEPLLACPDGLIFLSFIGLDERAYYMIPDPKMPGYFTARQIVEHYRPDLLDAYDTANPTGKYKPFIRRK